MSATAQLEEFDEELYKVGLFFFFDEQAFWDRSYLWSNGC